MSQTNTYTKHKINYSFYSMHDIIAIEDVCQMLGLKPGKNGKYLCPCHNDHDPSMIVTADGKYENKFKCFVCNETGDVLSLVRAVLYDLPPSYCYRNSSEEVRQATYDAAQWIEDNFSIGAYEVVEEEPRERDPFNIPAPILSAIGLQPNILNMQKALREGKVQPKTAQALSKKYNYTDEPTLKAYDTMPLLSKEELAVLLCDAFNIKIEQSFDRLCFLIGDKYKDLSSDGKTYIGTVIANKTDVYETYKDDLVKYLESVQYEYEPTIDISNFKTRRDAMIEDNFKILDTIYQTDDMFPRLSDGVIKTITLITLKTPLRTLLQQYDFGEIAEMILKAMDDWTFQYKQQEEKLFSEFKDLSPEDKKYVHSRFQYNNAQMLQNIKELTHYIDIYYELYHREFMLLPEDLQYDFEEEYEKE